jgi:hypothetical protein
MECPSIESFNIECHNFYTLTEITFKKNKKNKFIDNQIIMNKNIGLFIKKYHSAYIYNNTFEKYKDNLFELWEKLNYNDGTKLETIEDHEFKTEIVCYNKKTNKYYIDDNIDYLDILPDNIVISSKIDKIYWE